MTLPSLTAFRNLAFRVSSADSRQSSRPYSAKVPFTCRTRMRWRTSQRVTVLPTLICGPTARCRTSPLSTPTKTRRIAIRLTSYSARDCSSLISSTCVSSSPLSKLPNSTSPRSTRSTSLRREPSTPLQTEPASLCSALELTSLCLSPRRRLPPLLTSLTACRSLLGGTPCQ